MSRRIIRGNGRIRTPADHLSRDYNQRSYRDFARRGRLPSQIQRLAHEQFVHRLRSIEYIETNVSLRFVGAEEFLA